MVCKDKTARKRGNQGSKNKKDIDYSKAFRKSISSLASEYPRLEYFSADRMGDSHSGVVLWRRNICWRKTACRRWVDARPRRIRHLVFVRTVRSEERRVGEE